MNPSYDGGAPPYPGQPAPNMPPQYGNMPPQYGNPQPNMTPQYGNPQPNMPPQYGNMQPNMTPQYGNMQPNMTPQNGNMQPGPNVKSNFAQSKLDEVNACDLPPTSENDPSAPMPDDLPSYSDYVGKLTKQQMIYYFLSTSSISTCFLFIYFRYAFRCWTFYHDNHTCIILMA